MSRNRNRVRVSERGGVVRYIGWVAALLLAVALIWAISRPQPVPADVVSVARGAMQVTLDEEGETRVRDRYVVSAPVSGRVLRIELEPGDPVVAGETVLATFQPVAPVLLDARSQAEAEARVRAAEAGLGQAKAEQARLGAELDYAERQLERQERLSQDQVVAAERLDLAKLDADRTRDAVEAAEFAVRAAGHELEMARAGLLQATGKTRDGGRPLALTSPVDGVVLSRSRESEAVVPGGEPLLEVADPGRLEIVSDFLSTDAVKIQPGQKVLIDQWGGEHALNGTVRRVEPSGFTKISALGVEEQRVNVIIDLTDPRERWPSLGDGFRVEVRVVIWQADDVLKVPNSALFRPQSDDPDPGWAVFRLEAARAVATPVEIGRRNRLYAEVLGGLEAGQAVIVHASESVEDGALIEPRE